MPKNTGWKGQESFRSSSSGISRDFIFRLEFVLPRSVHLLTTCFLGGLSLKAAQTKFRSCHMILYTKDTGWSKAFLLISKGSSNFAKDQLAIKARCCASRLAGLPTCSEWQNLQSEPWQGLRQIKRHHKASGL